MYELKKFAKKRHIKLNGEVVKDTPLLIPSFSSKVLPNVGAALNSMEETIGESSLVSAYDVHYSNIKTPICFTDFLVIDSGGYECSETFVPQEGEKSNFKPKKWNCDLYKKTLEEMQFNDKITKTAIVSFDHPDIRESLDAQIRNAKSFFKDWKDKIKIFLFKPENESEIFLNIDNIINFIQEQEKNLSVFDVIGFTDKELGPSLLDRMATIVKIRNALNEKESNTPIHIFGSLDTVTTPLYFISGADMFDGLSWFKFYFKDEFVHYFNSGAYRFESIKKDDKKIAVTTWIHNMSQIEKLQNKMMGFLATHDFKRAFGDTLSKFFEDCKDMLTNKMSEGD